MAEVLPASLQAFRASPVEQEASKYFFGKADVDGLGVLTGDRAVPFFARSRLRANTLGEVWQLSDPENSGFLSPLRFAVALRLISHVQQAQQASGSTRVLDAWISAPTTPPFFEGLALPAGIAAKIRSSTTGPAPRPASTAPFVGAQSTGASLPPQTTGGGSSTAGRIVTPEERAKYLRLFASSGPQDGLLDGERARDLFIKSRLPIETLGHIWNLADTQQRGALDVTEFIVGMHLIQHTMNGTLKSLPETLPPALYESAKNASAPAPAAANGTSARPASAAPAVAAPAAATAATPRQAPAVASPQTTGPATRSSIPWDISPSEKAQSDVFFQSLDAQNRGVIEGDVAVPFMVASQLPQATLAVVWDLADIKGLGALSADEFAVAVRLIRDAKAGKPLPSTLPLALVPPSLRSAAPAGPAAAAAAAPQPAAAPATPRAAPVESPKTLPPQNTAQRDLLSLIDEDTPGQAKSGTPSAPAAAAGGAAAGAAPAALASATPSSAPSTGFDDDFSSAPPSAPAAPPHQGTPTHAASRDLPAAPQPSQSPSSHQTQLITAEAERARLEQEEARRQADIAAQQTQERQSRDRLTAVQAAVAELKRRESEQLQLLEELKRRVVSAESQVSALDMEKTQIEQAVLASKEAIRDHESRLAASDGRIATIRQQIESHKSQAAQHDSLLATHKKSLADSEAEHAAYSKELDLHNSGKQARDAELANALAAAEAARNKAAASKAAALHAKAEKESHAKALEQAHAQASSSEPSEPHHSAAFPAAAAGAGIAGVAGAAAASSASSSEPSSSREAPAPAEHASSLAAPTSQQPARASSPFDRDFASTASLPPQFDRAFSFDDAFGDPEPVPHHPAHAQDNSSDDENEVEDVTQSYRPQNSSLPGGLPGEQVYPEEPQEPSWKPQQTSNPPAFNAFDVNFDFDSNFDK